MPEENSSFRQRMMNTSQGDRDRIDSALASNAAPWVVGGIIAIAVIWAIVSTFIH